MLGTIKCARESAASLAATASAIGMEQHRRSGTFIASQRSMTSAFRRDSSTAMTRRENKFITTAKFNQPLSVQMYVICRSREIRSLIPQFLTFWQLCYVDCSNPKTPRCFTRMFAERSAAHSRRLQSSLSCAYRAERRYSYFMKASSHTTASPLTSLGVFASEEPDFH